MGGNSSAADLVSTICMVEIGRYRNYPGLLLLYGKINGSQDGNDKDL